MSSWRYRKLFEYECFDCGQKRKTIRQEVLKKKINICGPCKKIAPLEGQTSLFDGNPGDIGEIKIRFNNTQTT